MNNIGGFESHPTIAVAISGGSDSVALTHLLHHWIKEQGGTLHALTVHHHLRPEADEECNAVAAQMKKWGIPHTILHWKHDGVHSNIQEKARHARLDLLEHYCKEHGILHLAFGHHADDQKETMLMRLERGSGLFGLSSMPMVRYAGDVRIIRPLLGCSKDSITDYLKEHKLSWSEDPSNHNEAFTRVTFRKEWQSIEASRLVDAATNLGHARHFMMDELAVAAVHTVQLYPFGMARLDLPHYKTLHEELATRLLASLLQTIGGGDVPPRFEKLMRLHLHLHTSPTVKKTLACTSIVPKGDHIFFFKEPAHVQSAPLTVTQTGSYIWDERFVCEITLPEHLSEVQITQAKPTDINISIPPSIPRDAFFSLPALTHLETCIAIPHIEYYDGEAMRGGHISFRWLPRRSLTECWIPASRRMG